MTIIYALLCPQSGDVRYVGKTDMNLARRLSSHIMGCESGRDKHLAKNIWIAGLVKGDLVPIIKIIERVPDGEPWEPAEIRWIAHYREQMGASLLNAAIGGRGPRGVVVSAETRERISAAGKLRVPYPRKPHSEATRAKISATLKSKPSSQPIGYRHSAETLAKMSESAKNRATISEVTRSKLSAAKRGHTLSPEARAKIGAKVSASAARKRAVKEAQT